MSRLEYSTLADIAADPSLDDLDLVKCDDNPDWQMTVRELRAAQEASLDQRTSFERELGRRVGGPVRVLTTNANLGTGTYTIDGTTPKPFTFTGTTILTPTFVGTVNAGGPLKGQVGEPTPSPDPYAKDLAALRAASATPLSTFEAEWKAERTREFERTRATLDAEPLEPRLTAAERAEVPDPPNPWKEGIALLRERDARRLAAKEGR